MIRSPRSNRPAASGVLVVITVLWPCGGCDARQPLDARPDPSAVRIGSDGSASERRDELNEVWSRVGTHEDWQRLIAAGVRDATSPRGSLENVYRASDVASGVSHSDTANASLDLVVSIEVAKSFGERMIEELRQDLPFIAGHRRECACWILADIGGARAASALLESGVGGLSEYETECVRRLADSIPNNETRQALLRGLGVPVQAIGDR